MLQMSKHAKKRKHREKRKKAATSWKPKK